MKEEWKDIEGYEGYYQVSNMGNVKSLNYRHTSKERILKPQKNNDGYLNVQLYQDGKGKIYKVHRLVATAFCENQMGYTEVNHINEDKSDNRAENIEWCSRSYNINYGTHNKRSAEKRRNDPRMSKPVIGINKVSGLILEFPSTREAERMTGINHNNIIKCCQGKANSAGGHIWFYADDEDAE